MNIIHAIEYHLYHPHMHVSWWKRCSKCMLWSAIWELLHQQIFDRGDYFHLLQRRATHLVTIVGAQWIAMTMIIVSAVRL